ncbi:MAG: D-2-hydroxyacid dehydrogenase [Bdellovibrionota bacterium]
MLRPLTVLVLAEPETSQLELLKNCPPEIQFILATSFAEIGSRASEIEAILVWSGKVGGASGIVPECVARLPNLRWIHTRWAGMDAFLFPELIQSNIVVTNARGVYAESLAEFVIGGILYFAKDFPRMRRNQLARQWSPFDVRMIAGSTLGIFGYGAIGKACAERAKAMKMNIVAIRRSPEKALGDLCVDEIHPPEELLAISPRLDYLVVTAPLTESTRGAVGKDVFEALPNAAVVLNVGRGPVVDEPALIEALSSGQIRGAALDVFTHEPLHESSPFYEMENVLLSPHCADNTETWLDDTMLFFRENLLRFASGKPLENIVDKRAGY